MPHLTSCLLTLALASVAPSTPLASPAQQEDLDVLFDGYTLIQHLSAQRPGAIWPGFRPDSVPVVFVLPDKGGLLVGWEGALPDGYVELTGLDGAGWQAVAERGAASTGIKIEGRNVAQVVVDELELPQLIGNTVHEMFHAFQNGARRDGRRFGQGENSFLVTRYPIFDPVNEADVALEGQLLAAALGAEDVTVARELARQFVAVRESRQRKLDAELADFEAAAELNEGLAQYAGVRALRLLAEDPSLEWRDAALAESQRMVGDLDRLTAERERSFRLRYYASGSAQALLLDRIAGPGWRSRLVDSNFSLQDLLAEVVGSREAEKALRQQAEAVFAAAELTEAARRSVAALRATRRAQVDSALSRPGVQVVILGDALGFMGLCGIDPQNLLQVDDRVLFHTRWLVLCAGSSFRAEFTTPVVHDQDAATMRAVVGPVDELQVSVDGAWLQPSRIGKLAGAERLEIEAPGLKLTAARADLEWEGSRLQVRPLRT